MKKNLFSAGVLLLSVSLSAQLTFVGNGATVTVQPNTLVYNGGGLRLDNTGVVNNSGNIMLVGSSTDAFVTGTAATSKLTLVSTSNSEYGQLYIDGISQTNLNTGVVNRQYITANNGTYQQMAMPFSQKVLSTLNTELGKTFTNTRYSKNEILTWTNATAVSDFFNVNIATTSATDYYIVGANGINFPTLHTLSGIPYANLPTMPNQLTNAANGINFGAGGNNRNAYNERYNTYLQDNWDYLTNTANPWSVTTFGKNIYQFGNPFFTNLDLSGIYKDTPDTDGNFINNIQGMRIDPGNVISNNSGTYTTNARFVNFAETSPGSGISTTIPIGDVNDLIIKPLQTFVIKLRNNTVVKNLNFNTLRRFANTPRVNSTYSVTSARAAGNTIKQLGVIALDKDNNEIGRAYYVVYGDGATGNTSKSTVQSTNTSTNIIGTYEERPNTGGIDPAFENTYWLYINEANEQDFKGKPVSLATYSTDIAKFKFEIRENAELIPAGEKLLSAGLGFNYKDAGGDLKEISQDQVVPVNGDMYSLYYGKPEAVLATGNIVDKPSRTIVVFNPAIDNYIVRFDPNWKKAEVQVFDLSGKLVLSRKEVSADNDFVLELSKERRAYIVTAVSEKGEKASAKIVR